MRKSHLLGALSAVLFTFITVSANAALLGRLPSTPGGMDYQAAYDDVLDITWVTNASLSGSNTWDNQVAWASGLDYLGFDDWRLASMSVTAGTPDAGFQTSIDSCPIGGDCPTNELGHMYYQNMDGTLLTNKTGDQTVDGVLLTDVQSHYWSGTEYDSISAWSFGLFDFIAQQRSGKLGSLYGWAVRAGDVSAVPVPAAVWLFSSGLLGLIGIARRKKS